MDVWDCKALQGYNFSPLDFEIKSYATLVVLLHFERLTDFCWTLLLRFYKEIIVWTAWIEIL